MKTVRIITIACWVVAAMALAGLAIWFLSGTVFGIGSSKLFAGLGAGFRFENLTGPYEEVGSYSVPSGNVGSLNIDWVAGEINVTPYDGSDIQITEFAQRALQDDEMLSYSASGGTLTVKFTERNFRTIGNIVQKKLDVLVPRELSESMNRFEISSTSGAVNVSDMSAQTFKVATVSGEANLRNISSQKLTISSTSASIKVDSAVSDEMSIKTVSGSINVSGTAAKMLSCGSTSSSQTISGAFDDADLSSISGKIEIDNSAQASSLKVDTTSGAIEASGQYDSATLDSTSGRVTISSAIVPSSLKVRTISAAIKITVPDEGAITVRHSSTSGKLSSDIPVTLQNSNARFNLSSTSGNVNIHKY